MEILEKGLRNPKPYKSIYYAYQKTFPAVNLPPFADMQNSFYESSPLSLLIQDKKIGVRQSQDRIISHFDQSRAYSLINDGKQDMFILYNNFLQTVFLGMVTYDIANVIVPELYGQPQQAIIDSGLLSFAVFASVLFKRAGMYHEFAHITHYSNNPKNFKGEQPAEEYLSDGAAWYAMQNGSLVDRLASMIFIARNPEYIRRFIVKEQEESQDIMNYLNGIPYMLSQC